VNGPPALTDTERASAREAALDARRQRAAIRRALADGSLTVGISATRRVRGLGVRQMAALRELFPAEGDHDVHSAGLQS